MGCNVTIPLFGPAVPVPPPVEPVYFEVVEKNAPVHSRRHGRSH